ncbi:Dot/Icm secretion system substrate [Legionella steigerwaltii]|uniref:Dot/Icm secretion system substrate n=1 Tax=Legionella steigerwaltii TaxID=460 RepID=A0A378LCH5_9GAMM|nr:hypothetical protein [Legionella steigerwaltii]KTD75315.1 substrate of the Dot/Icm secretion system [Legionella steigerwaltii]STY21811.1 Dot/Icm secretion system substrate [Legionella steigerwaltii]
MEAKTISPITSTKDVQLPNREDLLRAMKMAETSPEVAQYLSKRVHERVAQSRYINKTPEAMEVAQQIIKAVDEFAVLVAFKYPPDRQVWSGIEPKSSNIEYMHEAIAQNAADSLVKKNYPGIRFDFAISETGHFVRGYASTDKGAPHLDDETVDTLDRLFNAWLANKHHVITENGDFFKMNAQGQKTGNKMTVDEVEALLSNSAQEYKDYLKEQKVGTELVSRQREYPGEHRMEEARHREEEAKKKAIDKIFEEEKFEEKAEEEVQPTGGMGRS